MSAPHDRPPPINLHEDSLHIGHNFAISFERTLRIPDDGGSYPRERARFASSWRCRSAWVTR